jgi:hypothetical protein
MSSVTSKQVVDLLKNARRSVTNARTTHNRSPIPANRLLITDIYDRNYNRRN